MKLKIRYLSVLCVIALVMTVITAGCSTYPPPSPAPAKPTPALSLDNQASVYTAVIHRLATEDDTFGGNLKPPVLYIIRETDDKAGDPTGTGTFSTIIPQTVQDGVADALKDIANIVWIDKFEDAEFEEGDAGGEQPMASVKDGGAIITLGNARLQDDGSVLVAGSIYVAALAAGGTTYVLEKKDGVWEISGTTGVMWIS